MRGAAAVAVVAVAPKAFADTLPAVPIVGAGERVAGDDRFGTGAAIAKAGGATGIAYIVTKPRA